MGNPLPRLHVRNLFFVALGLVHLAAFVSLAVQVPVLIGSRGLLPAAPWLEALRDRVGFADLPTVFWVDASDRTLQTAAGIGVALSLGLVWGVAPRLILALLWALYLSFVSVGQVFFAFQWDQLLLETTLLALFVAPGRVDHRGNPPALPAVFLMQWLLVRLHVESGLAKLLSGDPSWRDLTAMVTYYETAPLPTWLGWYAHQLPAWCHRLSAFATLVIEIVVPWGIWGPRWMRRASVGALAMLQVLILATANYGFFNYLTLALCLGGLDDGDLAALARKLRVAPTVRARTAAKASHTPRWRALALWVLVAVWVPLSLVPFFHFIPPLRGTLQEWRSRLEPFRSVNAYHLFASMTYVRNEAVIEGSNDGHTWSAYEFHYKPGAVTRAPGFVAPHQPRVDFQMWFLLLRGRAPRDRYFQNLLARVLTSPDAVRPLFARDPFDGRPPKWLRVQVYRYRFTDGAVRRTTGAWWQRELLASLGPVSADDFAGALPRD